MKDYEDRNEAYRLDLDEMGEPLHALFFNLGCNTMFNRQGGDLGGVKIAQGAYQDLVDERNLVSASNIQRYIGVIEQRAVELMQVRSAGPHCCRVGEAHPRSADISRAGFPKS